MNTPETGFPVTKSTAENMMKDFTWFYKLRNVNPTLQANTIRILPAVALALAENPNLENHIHFHHILLNGEFSYMIEVTETASGNALYYRIASEDLVLSSATELTTLKQDYLNQVNINNFSDNTSCSIQLLTTDPANPAMGAPTRCTYSLTQFYNLLWDNQDFIFSDVSTRTFNPTARLRLDHGAVFIETYQPVGYAGMFKVQTPVLSIESNNLWQISDDAVAGPLYRLKGMDNGRYCPPQC